MSVSNLLNGLLPIIKPAGISSKDVSRILVKQVGKLHLGHVGTLDPMADGVLPILIGHATKLQDYLLELPKSYVFTVQFGYETDTLDATGQVHRREPVAALDRHRIEQLLSQFTGAVSQIPPLYSAIKVNGRALYRYARAGEEPALPLADMARNVWIYELCLTDFNADSASFRVRCSKGTYVRSLARDIAFALGTVGTVTHLTRTAAAGFELKDCLPLEKLSDLSDLSACLVPFEKVFFGLPIWSVQDKILTDRLQCGQRLLLDVSTFMCSFQDCDNHMNISSEKDRDLLLIDHSQRVFGIGSYRIESEINSVKLHMKRGLV